MSDEEKYRELFGLGKDPVLNKASKALELALDIRKFEIGLYWQRATYFWALIAVAFAGYFAILGSEHLDHKEFLAHIVSCIGLVFSWAWYLVNRGSKYWQENWENHVELLEDGIAGPLYKTILYRPESKKNIEEYLTGPLPISVSKINLMVSFFTVLVWGALFLYSLPPLHYTWALDWTETCKHVVVGGSSLFVMWWMRFRDGSRAC